MNYKVLFEYLTIAGFEGDLDIDPEKTFYENNIDSLDVYSWLATVEEKTGVSISDEEFALINSPKDLLDFIVKNQKSEI